MADSFRCCDYLKGMKVPLRGVLVPRRLGEPRCENTGSKMSWIKEMLP
jgi:hypothetical protein